MLISICIPTYNRPDQVKKCVKKCLEIPEDFYEILIQDNSTNYETERVVQEFHDPRIRYIKNEKIYGYANMGYALKNGRGEYCLLLGDKDELICSDWNKVRKTIEADNKTSIYHWQYIDSDGAVLRAVRDRDYNLKKEDFRSLVFAKYHFAYSAGFMIRRKDIEEIWDMVDKESLLWSLYPQVILAMLSVIRGGCTYIEAIETRCRGEKRVIHYAQSIGRGKYPYWTTEGRLEQNLAWISFIYEMRIKNEWQSHLAHTILVNAIKQYGDYCRLIHDFKSEKNELFYGNDSILLRDKAKTFEEWKREIDKTLNILKQKKKDFDAQTGSFILMDIEYYIRRLKMKYRIYKVIQEQLTVS